MKAQTIKLFLLLYLLCFGTISYSQKAENGLPLIIAKEVGNNVVIEKIFIENGQMKVINDPAVLTIILPISEGTAGSIIKAKERNELITIKNNNNRLEIKFRSKSGIESTYPMSALPDELKSFQIRVNIINGDGYKKAYLIENYEIIEPDDGPVLDMFKGMIPLEKDDYSFTITTKKTVFNNKLYGNVPFRIIDGWIVVEASLANGKKGMFIVDTGASGGLVLEKSSLPKNTTISELKAVSYSMNSTKESKGQMQGATGSVSDNNFLGVAQIQSFEMGDIKLDKLKANILDQFPNFLIKNNIIGIIGMDILRQAEIMQIENINLGKGNIRFLNEIEIAPLDQEFNLNTAKNLLFLKGTIQETPIDFLIDIGSRKNLLGNNIIEDNQISYTTINEKAGITGIDGLKTDAIEAQISGLTFQNKSFDSISFVIGSNLAVTKMMGLEKSGAVLGMNFYKQFKTVKIDFINNKLYLNK